VKINGSEEHTLKLVGVGRGKSGYVYTISGPESPVGIISQRTLDHQLSELLNDLERRILDLEFRFSRVCATSLADTILPAVRLLSIINVDTTEK
jgi:hypothetical protein